MAQGVSFVLGFGFGLPFGDPFLEELVEVEHLRGCRDWRHFRRLACPCLANCELKKKEMIPCSCAPKCLLPYGTTKLSPLEDQRIT